MIPDRELLDRIFAELTPRAESLGIRSLSPPERHVLAAVTGKGIIDNGGLGYFYECFTEIDLVADAFETLGYADAAEACRRSTHAFPNPAGFPDLEIQRQWLHEAVPEDGPTDKLWDQLSRAIWDIPNSDLDRRMAAYIRTHPDVFGL